MNWIIEYKENKDAEISCRAIDYDKIELYFKYRLVEAIEMCDAYSNGYADKIIIKGLDKNDEELENKDYIIKKYKDRIVWVI